MPDQKSDKNGERIQKQKSIIKNEIKSNLFQEYANFIRARLNFLRIDFLQLRQSKNLQMTSKPKQLKLSIPIDDFNGYYEFLNNDFPTWIQYEGLYYPNVTTAFQAARTSNVEIRKKISQLQNYEQFKQLVSSIKNPQNWYTNRYKVMQKLVRDKFKRNKQISNKIASTEERKLYNCYKTSGENELYWGVVKQKSENDKTEYKGTNSLGRILQMVRIDIIKMQDTQKWVTFQNLQEDEQLFPEVSLTVLKQNQPIEKLLLEKRNYFLLGSHPKCQYRLQHPSISKFHAVIYFSQLQVIIVDTNSTHGTFILKKGQSEKQRLEPLQKKSLANGDTIIFGMSSRTYACNINFQKLQAALKRKQQQIQKNVKGLGEVNSIKSDMNKDQIKSRIGYKKYEGLHVQNIDQHYSYNDIKQLFKKFGSVQRVRMIQNYKNSKFEGEVVIIYESKVKIEQLIKDIKASQDKQIQKMQLKPVDKYDMEKILERNKQDRQKDRNQDRAKNDRNRAHKDDRDRRSRSREKQRKQKHKKYEKHQRDDSADKIQRKRDR